MSIDVLLPAHAPSAAYLENREGWQGLGGRHFTQGRRPTVIIGGIFGGSFRRWRAPEGGRKSPWRDFRRRAHIFPVKHSQLEGTEQSQKAPSAPKGGHGPVAPLPMPPVRLA